jgi:DNA-binding transcriptional MerR regulator
MQIGELSTRTGATVRMLRYYEEHGLLEPERTDAGYRTYAETDVLRVGHIRCMLASALPTGVVRQALRFLLDEPPPIPEQPEDRAQLASVLRDELDALTERIEILNRSRDQLARFVDDVTRAVVGPARPLPAGETPPTEFGPAVRQGAPLSKTRRRPAQMSEPPIR